MPDLFQMIFADGAAGFSAAAIFALIFFGTLVSEDAACVLAGTLAANGRITLTVAITAAFLGIVVGDVLLYFAGRMFGEAVLGSKYVSRFVSPAAIERSSVWLNERGASAVFISRFITGLRLPTYLAAGAFRTGFASFLFYFIVAALVWTPLLVGAAYSGTSVSGSSIIAAAVILIAIRFALKYSNWKNRRLFVGRVKRLVNWEFWPLQVFYTPVVFYVAYLAIRFRSLTAFTCANPAIPTGGLAGESKNEIYLGLGESEYSLRHTLLSLSVSDEAGYTLAKEFMAINELYFPVVLKPDKGERGRGVSIVRCDEELRRAFEDAKSDLILQEFFDGAEASVFYYRYPDQPRGRIFSITEKRFPGVTGDGRSSIESLILNDERAVCLARSYFEQNKKDLQYVPAKGVDFQIIDIGTHSRGAIFLDGSWLWTHKLESTIDELCRGYDGFYFGRFDIRAKSFDDLRHGRFKIIELNGVSSESTNIYDPGFSLIAAYRTLFVQWRIAFEIGTQNWRQGARTTPFRELIRTIFGYNISVPKTNTLERPFETCA
jgi:membrane protein DedA with SNARE-associated domain